MLGCDRLAEAWTDLHLRAGSTAILINASLVHVNLFGYLSVALVLIKVHRDRFRRLSREFLIRLQLAIAGVNQDVILRELSVQELDYLTDRLVLVLSCKLGNLQRKFEMPVLVKMIGSIGMIPVALL